MSRPAKSCVETSDLSRRVATAIAIGIRMIRVPSEWAKEKTKRQMPLAKNPKADTCARHELQKFHFCHQSREKCNYYVHLMQGNILECKISEKALINYSAKCKEQFKNIQDKCIGNCDHFLPQLPLLLDKFCPDLCKLTDTALGNKKSAFGILDSLTAVDVLIMIKRRSGECGKRRPSKRSKLTEGICSRLFVASSTVLYLKFLVVWALVLLADFMLEFRFEYLWPLWLMIRSVYDSFKFQGLAFSMFFALIALSSDLICFFFIPIHWLFFAASTYVWVQYVWHTDRGVCLPTVSLWLLFVYIEASVRLKELKTPYNLDLCRPFAAHCIGYPVVTLGFGFKSYVSYRLRLRKQREVAKENQFYKELLQQALPQDSLVSVPSMQESNVSCNDLTNGTSNNHSSSPLANSCTVIANGNSVNLSNGHQSQVHHVNSHSHSTTTTSTTNTNKSSRSAHSQVDSGKLLTGNNKSAANESSDQKKSSLSNGDPNSKNSELFIDKQCMEQVNNHQSNNHNHHRSSNKVTNSINDFDEHSDSQVVGHKMPVKTPINATLSKGDVNRKDQVSTPISSLVSSASSSSASTKNNVNNVISSTGHVSEVIPPNPPSVSTSSSGKKRNDKNKDSNIVTNNLLTPNATYKSSVKDELVFKLESEIKKLKADLQSSKANEQELRSRLNQATSDDKGARAEIQALQQNNDQLHLDKENLLAKYNNLVSAMQQEKQSTSMLEKRIQEEKKLNASLESQLNNERKARQKAERSLEHQQSESNASSKASSSRSSQSSMPNSPFSNNTCTNGTSECSSEVCKLKRKEIECEINSLRREMSIREEKIRQMDREAQSLRQYKETQNDTELLMSAFSAMKEKAQHLEYSLSAETRLKLDLFSALGDAKRQLEISHALMAKKEKEIDELKSKIAEVMAVMPTTSTAYSPIESSLVSSILFNSSNCKYLHSDAASNTISNSNSNGSHLESALSKVLCEANGTTSLYSPQVVPSDL